MGDACECICSFQWAMRRLVEIINQAQAYCTDDECNDGPGQVNFLNLKQRKWSFHSEI